MLFQSLEVCICVCFDQKPNMLYVIYMTSSHHAHKDLHPSYCVCIDMFIGILVAQPLLILDNICRILITSIFSAIISGITVSCFYDEDMSTSFTCTYKWIYPSTNSTHLEHFKILSTDHLFGLVFRTKVFQCQCIFLARKTRTIHSTDYVLFV